MTDPRETLFSGPALEPREDDSSFGWLMTIEDDEDGVESRAAPTSPAPRVEVRHARGYGLFAERVTETGEEPAMLAADLAALIAFISAHAALLEDAAVADAAGTFFGNALIVAHPSAAWRQGRDREVGTDTRSVPVDQALQYLVEDPARVVDLLGSLPEWTAADARQALVKEAMDAVMSGDGAPVPLTPVRPFVRPAIPRATFLDGAGLPIPYGDRWSDSPPDDSYSRLTHPERFAPVHAVTDALIRHLGAEYVVSVTEERNPDGERVVRVAPAAGATVTVRFTALPGVEIRAGAFFREVVPTCGCDACDETAETAARQVEAALLAVAAGGLAERWPVGPAGDHVVGLWTPDGASGTSSATDPFPSAAMRAALAALPDGRWPAWPLRSS